MSNTVTGRRAASAAVAALAVVLAAVGAVFGGYLWSKSYADQAPQVSRVSASDPAANADHTYLIDCSRQPVVRPAQVTLTCADANTALTHVRWQTWGGPDASGTATYVENDCTPDCAAGTLAHYRALVTADRLTRMDGTATYRRVMVRFPAGHPRWVKGGRTAFLVTAAARR